MRNEKPFSRVISGNRADHGRSGRIIGTTMKNDCYERKMNKMKKLISVFLALALCCAMLPAFAEEGAPVGTWYISGAEADGIAVQVVDPNALTVTVNEDGTFTLAASGLGVEQKGSWSVADGKITLKIDEENSTEFRIDGDRLVYNMGATIVYLSRTPAEPAAIAEAVPAESAEAFDGTWTPCAQLMMGLYSPLKPETAAAAGSIVIGGGKMNSVYKDDAGNPYVASSTDVTFADGSLTFEDTTFGTKGTLSLLKDGTLRYSAVTTLGETNFEAVYFYVLDANDIIAKLPEAGWVLDAVNGAVWMDDRASLSVFLEDVDNYKVQILWGSSAWESTEWVYACDYDAETQTLKARYVVCDNLVFDDAGNDERTNVFEKESDAVFSLDADGKLVIRNAGDDALEGKTFENTGSREGE